MITQRMMLQAITDRLARLETDFSLEDFSGIYRLAWQAMDECKPGREVEAISSLPLNAEQRKSLKEGIQATIPGAGTSFVKVPTAAELDSSIEPIEFLWPGWIPRGMITLLAASPGSGKSLLALDLCRRLLNGEAYPDGKGAFNPASKVMYVDAENSPQILFDRLRAWNLDMERLHIKLPGDRGFIDFDDHAQRDVLIEQVYHYRPEFLAIDALGNITTRGENYIEEIRDLLAFLNNLAGDFRTNLLLVHHLRKAGFRNRSWYMSIDDIRGSGHIIAMARSVLGLSQIQENNRIDPAAPRHLAIIKTNVGSVPPALGFELKSLEPRGVELLWGKPKIPTQIQADAVSQLEGCVTWLRGFLSESGIPVKPREAVDMGMAQGYSERTIQRAYTTLRQGRADLGGYVRSVGGRQNPRAGWQWFDAEEADPAQTAG